MITRFRVSCAFQVLMMAFDDDDNNSPAPPASPRQYFASRYGHAVYSVGMAGPVVSVQNPTYPSAEEDESDYGSDFSAEEQEIIDRLLASAPSNLVAEDNLIASDVEHPAPPAAVRISRFVAREPVQIKYESQALNVESVQSNAEISVNDSLDPNPGYPDCKSRI
jgi:hypothetical protein